MEPADTDFRTALALTCRAVENDRRADDDGCVGLKRVADEYRARAQALVERGLDLVR